MIALESLGLFLALNFDGTGSHLFSQSERKRGNFYLDSKTSLFNFFGRKRQNCCILLSWIGALCFQHTNYYRFSLRAHCLLTTASTDPEKCILSHQKPIFVGQKSFYRRRLAQNYRQTASFNDYFLVFAELWLVKLTN